MPKKVDVYTLNDKQIIRIARMLDALLDLDKSTSGAIQLRLNKAGEEVAAFRDEARRLTFK